MSLTVMNRSQNNRWLTLTRENTSSKLRLFCFPYAGGGAQIFYNWQMALPASVEVCPVQLPGRGNRLMEHPFTQLMTLVEAVAESLMPHLNKPFAFFGHSMGSLIGFELTRLLRRECALQPVHLFVSGRTAPQIADPDLPTYNLPEDGFMAELHRLKGTPKELLGNVELMQLMLPLLRADFEVCQTYPYRDERPLECPITTYGGLDDEHVNYEQFKAWEQQTNGAFRLRMFPGGHFFLHSERELLLQTLSVELHELVRALPQSTASAI
jgi:medium-chain acyl-[acyl-carrier-protein] hydrolase